MQPPKSIVDHYNNCLKNNTDPLLQVDWTNREAAVIRYKIIRMFYRELRTPKEFYPTILDFGCGTAELLNYFTKDVDYVGIDASKEMIAAAKQRFPNHRFYCTEEVELGMHDLVVINGVFTEKRDVYYSDMLDYVVAQLKILWKHTKKGLIFNFMNYHKIPVDKQYDTLFFVDYSLLDSILREVGISRYIIDNSHKELNDYFVKCYKD